jgi:subtilisin family serine protease
MAQSAVTPVEPVSDANQVAVSTAHFGIVKEAFENLDVEVTKIEDSADLGLTLIGLAGARLDTGETDPLGELLSQVYNGFRASYRGWLPTMGRNREVVPVTGAPHIIDGGGAGVPSVVDRRFDPRFAEPGSGVRVGVADTALFAHPWLTGAYQAAPASMFEEQTLPDYRAGHATFIAGLVLQQAPGATVEARRVLDDKATAMSWDVAKELVRFARSGVDVLNLSFGCFTTDNQAPLVLSTALDRLDPRVVVVAAAGNHGDTSNAGRPMWPAALEEVVAVATMNNAGISPPWSPDATLPWIDAAADGVDVASTYLTGEVELSNGKDTFAGYAEWSGTSFSAAKVSGAIASRIVPGETGARTALSQLISEAPRPGGGSVPWIH